LTPPPTVTVQLSQSNGPIAGDLYATVNVTLVDTNQQLSDVKLIVDGQKFYGAGSNNFTAFINSCEWPNGPHEIYAVATMVDAGETIPPSDLQTATNAAKVAIGISSSRFVNFSNYISQFFVATPFFDPTVAQTQEVVATFPENTCWQLTVLNYQDTAVRHFTNQSPYLYLAWDGNDDFGNPLPFGFYDYYIQARPARFGCPSGMRSSAALASPSSTIGPPSPATAKAGVFCRPAMQFSRNRPGNMVREHITISSLNPTNRFSGTNSGGGLPPPPGTASLAGYPTSPSEALAQGLTSYFVALPPMPPIVTNIGGVRLVIDWEDVYGPQPPIEIQIPTSEQEAFLQAASGTTMNGPQPLGPWPDQTYTTRTPTRIPGSIFMGHAGTVGLGWQGHHPTSPSFALPHGGVVSPSHPPYGPLKSSSLIANSFNNVMGARAWRTAFNLGDDNFNSTNLFPILGPGTGTSTYATKCNFGMYVGHMTATSFNDSDYSCTHSWFPIYNSSQPGAYQWIALPGCDFGPPNGASPLLWMAMFGCNSLQSQDWNDMWSKFLLPFPPNLRLLLGSPDGIFLHSIFGWRFAADMNGLTTQNNTPMTIAASWYDAAGAADQQTSKSLKWRFLMGTRHMSVCYRANSQGGTWKTIQDTIWSWSNDISYDWFDVSLDVQQVYP
jgi:hypothetical protein